VTHHLLSSVLRSHLRGGLSIFCALAIAVVSTFHVCGWAPVSSSPGEFGVYAASIDTPLGESDIGQEKCHVCAVVSLTVDGNVDAMTAMRDIVPAGRLVRLFSLQPQSTVPPPRA
jgi:hypothetical protein